MLDDGSLIELVYKRDIRRTFLALYSAGRWTLQSAIDLPDGRRLVPYSPENNLIKNKVIALPSEPSPCGSRAELQKEIASLIHRYVDLDPDFEEVASHYVLLTWVYDAFNEVPYLRFRGDFGSGKTRALLVVGSLCNKAFFASGASTVSPLFHIIDGFRGTLILDEADFRFSSEQAEIVKILNNGNVAGLPVLRTMMTRDKEFNPRAFQVYGPKIIATRSHYQDRALESRFLTEEMLAKPLRKDVPISLPREFDEQALALRNKLLMYRFRFRHAAGNDEKHIDAAFEPRLNQILLPLLSIAVSDFSRSAIRARAVDAQGDLVNERGFSTEGRILEIYAHRIKGDAQGRVSIAELAEAMRTTYRNDYERPITNRWIGSLIRKRLHMRTHKSNGNYVVSPMPAHKFAALCTRYGINISTEPVESGDMGTSDGTGSGR